MRVTATGTLREVGDVAGVFGIVFPGCQSVRRQGMLGIAVLQPDQEELGV